MGDFLFVWDEGNSLFSYVVSNSFSHPSLSLFDCLSLIHVQTGDLDLSDLTPIMVSLFAKVWLFRFLDPEINLDRLYS